MDNGLIEENNYNMFKKDNKLFQFDLDSGLKEKQTNDKRIKTKKIQLIKRIKKHKKLTRDINDKKITN